MKSEQPAERGKVDRRTFFSKSAGLSAGLALLALPGIATKVLAAKENKSKEEIHKELVEKAEKFMKMRLTCSQASFRAINDQFELGAGQTVRALMPFQGMTLDGETCGAVSGTLLALGFYFEPKDLNGSKRPGSSMKPGASFVDRFKEEFGSTRCRGVMKRQFGRYYNCRDPKQLQEFMKVAGTGKCSEVVAKAVSIACGIIVENS